MYLYETEAVIDTAGTTKPVRIALGSGYNDPTGPGYFAPVVADDSSSAVFRRTIYPDRLSFGLGQIDAGVVTGVALNGEYDWMADAGFGRTATMRLGDPSVSLDYSNFVVYARGIATGALVGIETFQIGWKDKTDQLDTPLSESLFAGTNSGTTGLEGTMADIGGQRKPRCWGKCLNIEPILVNSSLRIYAWRYSRAGVRIASSAILGVRNKGAAWTFQADYTTAATLAAASIDGGSYGTCKAESLIRMGGSDSLSAVRLDVLADTGSASHAAIIAKNILLDAGETTSTIDEVAINTLESARPYTVQYYTQDGTTRDALSNVLTSILAWAVTDTIGIYRFGLIPTGLGTAVGGIKKFGRNVSARATDVNLVSIQPLLDNDNKNIPAKSVQVRYAYRVGFQDISSLADNIPLTDKSLYSAEWLLTQVATNTDVTTMFANADAVLFDTLLTEAADAASIRDALLSIVSRKEHRYSVDIAADSNTIGLFQVGAIFNLYFERFGMQSGYQTIITETNVDARRRIVSLKLLGIGYV